MRSRLSTLVIVVVCVLGLCLATTASASLVSNLTNGGFETNNNGSAAYSSDVVSWSTVAQSGQTSPGIWVAANISNPSDVPTFIGGAALGLFAMGNWYSVPEPQLSYVYQSLGTIDSSDLGKKYTLSGSAGALNQPVGNANFTLAFATGTTGSASSIGTALASGVYNVASTGTGPVALTSWSTDFTPTTGNISQEVFAVVSIENVVAGHGGENQYFVDGISLTSSAIPEPGTIVMLLSGMFGLLAYAWRKRKKVD